MIIELFQPILDENKHQVIHFLNGLETSLKFEYKVVYNKPLIIIYSKDIGLEVVNLLKDRFPEIKKITVFPKDYKLVSNTWKQEKTSFLVDDIEIGGDLITTIAGPCSIESEEQIFSTAKFLASIGVKFIRGGAYKPRTSPYSFQGLKEEGLKLIRQAADQYHLKVVTEVMDTTLIDEVSKYADILQVGSRNMQNFFFLSELGKTRKPIMLKRGMYSKIEEWLLAAEYLLSGGNEKIILCERGIRTFDDIVRNTMDITAIPLIKSISHLPIFSDPSHGTGNRDLVAPVYLASIAAGADGLLVEVHPNPIEALSDGKQSLNLEQFENLTLKANQIAKVMDRQMDTEKYLSLIHS